MSSFDTGVYLALERIFLEPANGGTGTQEGTAGTAATTGEFFQKVGNILTTFRTSTQAVLIPLAALCIAICAFKIIVADNQQETSRAKSWLIGIIIGMALWFFAPVLANTIATLAQA